jgi:hypothetical protein
MLCKFTMKSVVGIVLVVHLNELIFAIICHAIPFNFQDLFRQETPIFICFAPLKPYSISKHVYPGTFQIRSSDSP